jgi:hypothetical protein
MLKIKDMYIAISIFVLISLLVACNSGDSSKTLSTPPLVQYQSTQSDEKKVYDISVNGKKLENYVDVDTGNLKNKQEKALQSILKSICPSNMKLIDILKDDLDNDGSTEILAAFGEESGSSSDTLDKQYEQLFLLKQSGNSYQNLGSIDTGATGWAYSMSVEILDKSKKKYLCLQTTNGFTGEGFRLFKIENNIAILVDSIFPPTGRGGRYLFDEDKDGISEKVSADYYTDSQQRINSIYFRWDGSEFKEYKTELTYENEEQKFMYPTDPEELIVCFIEASCLNVQDEINQIVFDNSVKEFKITDYFESYDILYSEFLGNKGDVLVKDNTKYIQVFKGQDSKDIYFTLKNTSGKWKIQSISTQEPEF